MSTLQKKVMRMYDTTRRVTQGKVYALSDSGRITDDNGEDMQPYMRNKYWKRCDEVQGLAGSDEEWGDEPKQQEQQDMSNETNKQADVPIFELRPFINGFDSMNISDAKVFDVIQNTENKIKQLQNIAAKSTKISDQIEAMEKAVYALVQFVDNR